VQKEEIENRLIEDEVGLRSTKDNKIKKIVVLNPFLYEP